MNRLGNPWVLALLVGLYPALFNASNNWFMFEPAQGVAAFGSVVLVAFVTLCGVYAALRVAGRLASKLLPADRPNLSSALERAERSIFAAACLAVLCFLMRQTLAELLPGGVGLAGVAAALVAAGLAYRSTPARGELGVLGGLSAALGLLCLASLAGGLYSIVTTARPGAGALDGEDDLARWGEVRLRERPDVYFIVPDGYPSRTALRAVFGIDDGGLEEGLAAQGFTEYDGVFSNYMYTVSSISASLGMRHHQYRGNVGNAELLGGRPFITSDRNPVVHVFRNNGYQVSYVHQLEYLFTMGCGIDLCSPTPAWVDALELLPGFLRRAFAGDRSLPSLERRALDQIDAALATDTPQFLYVHFQAPNHSLTFEQSREELAAFRSTFGDRIQTANATLLSLVSRILSRDDDALIIVSADHGAWGFGTTMWAEHSVLESVPDPLIALDHLGVRLAIRWPSGEPPDGTPIRSNVNLFRHVLAYLSGNDALLKDLAPDDGYLVRGRGDESVILQAVLDGEPLERLRVVPPAP
jgi:hypothetical protein